MNKSIIYKAKEDKDIQEDLRKLRALQQEPCDDCICRKHLLEEIASLKESPWFKDDTNCGMAIRKEAIEIVEDLCIRKEPSVNPQEPCEDCISRQAVLDKAVYTETEEGWNGMTVDVKDIEALPPVTPKNPKRETAKWIRRSDIMSWKWFECDRCTTGYDFATPYCPHCGCEMTNSETTYTTSAKEE